MKRFLVLLVLLFVSCGVELNDENFADYWVGLQTMSMDESLSDYGWTQEEVNDYWEEILSNPNRQIEFYYELVVKDREVAADFRAIIEKIYGSEGVEWLFPL